jgi:hypothetical protein
MNLTEQDLRQHLEAAARQANPPRFAVGDLAGSIRRRRRRIITATSACLAAVAALAVALPVGLNGASPGASSGAPPAAVKPVKFTVSVNGQRPSPRHALIRGFAVSPGEHLSIEVTVTVPSRARIEGIWLGVSTGTIGQSRTGPIGLRPILTHLRKHLQPGRHMFRLTWTVPAQLGNAGHLWLAGTWAGMLPETGPARSHEPLTQVGDYQYLAKLVLSPRAT